MVFFFVFSLCWTSVWLWSLVLPFELLIDLFLAGLCKKPELFLCICFKIELDFPVVWFSVIPLSLWSFIYCTKHLYFFVLFPSPICPVTIELSWLNPVTFPCVSTALKRHINMPCSSLKAKPLLQSPASKRGNTHSLSSTTTDLGILCLSEFFGSWK